MRLVQICYQLISCVPLSNSIHDDWWRAHDVALSMWRTYSRFAVKFVMWYIDIGNSPPSGASSKIAQRFCQA